MKQLTCEMCGGVDLLKKEGMFVCQNCQTKYSVEEAKKMMIEGVVQVVGTVQIDKTNSIDNYLQSAQQEFKIGNHNEVENLCKKILEIDWNNLQAWILRTKNAHILLKYKFQSEHIIREYSKKVFEIDPNNFEIALFMARFELNYDNALAKPYYLKAIDCANDSEVFMVYEDVKKIANGKKFNFPTANFPMSLISESSENIILALKLILERRRVSQELLKANFGSSARATMILSILEMKEFIYKPEDTNRWEINLTKIEQYLLSIKRGKL